MPADLKKVKLGKKRPVLDTKRTLKLTKYLAPGIIAPETLDYSKGIREWGMMGNGPDPNIPQIPDGVGNCTCAGVIHACQVWGVNINGTLPAIPDITALQLYENWCGYVVGKDSTDNGAIETWILNKWHKKKKVYGFKLTTYTNTDPADIEHVKLATWLFGISYIGLALPITCQNQTVWDVVGNPKLDYDSMPNSWGGHCVVVLGYDKETVTCITWGQLQKMTWEFWNTYCDESHPLLCEAWVSSGLSPSGFNYNQLYSDLTLCA